MPARRMTSAISRKCGIVTPGMSIDGMISAAEIIARLGSRASTSLKIVQEQIRFWAIETLEGLNEMGKKAQEKILGIPQRLERVADAMETRSRAKTFAFNVAFAREFSMD